jgi:hypothetical protein
MAGAVLVVPAEAPLTVAEVPSADPESSQAEATEPPDTKLVSSVSAISGVAIGILVGLIAAAGWSWRHSRHA